MNDVWLIAMDMDGTLLRTDQTMGEATKQAIQSLIAQGHIVAIATGRPPRAALAAYRELQLSTPLIALNGSYIQFSGHPDDVKTTHIDHSVLESISAAAIARGSRGMLAEFGSHCVIRQNEPPLLADKELERFFFMAVVSETPDSPTMYQPLDMAWSKNAFALLIQLPREQHAELMAWIESKWPQQIYTRSWRQPFDVIEIMSKQVNKATGLEAIRQRYGISPQHVMAFGDEMNDLEMFRYAAISVAMGNANPELAAHATAVTKDCNHDGIAYFLNTKFLPTRTLR